MKKAVLIAILLAVGFWAYKLIQFNKPYKEGVVADAFESEETPTTNTNKADGTTAKPVKELTLEEKVIGSYDTSNPDGGGDWIVFQKGRTIEIWDDEVKIQVGTWAVKNDKIHVVAPKANVVFKVNDDGDLELIATNGDSRGEGRVFKKIK